MRTQAVLVSQPGLVSLTPPPPSAQCSTQTDKLLTIIKNFNKRSTSRKRLLALIWRDELCHVCTCLYATVCVSHRFVNVLGGVVTFLLHSFFQKIDPELQVEVFLLQSCDLLQGNHRKYSQNTPYLNTDNTNKQKMYPNLLFKQYVWNILRNKLEFLLSPPPKKNLSFPVTFMKVQIHEQVILLSQILQML